MKRFKLFMENMLVYGLGGVIGKIIPIIMLPIVTRLMPNTYYFGINDIFTIIVSFGSAIAIMGMYDAMFRLFFDKEDDEYKKVICSTTLFITIIFSIIIFFIIYIFKRELSGFFFGDSTYEMLMVVTGLNILFGATNTIVSAPTRMKNQRKIFLITNTLTPLISYAVAIPALTRGYYVFGLPVAALISVIVTEIVFIFLNRNWFSFKKINMEKIKDLFKVGIPLLPNFLIYWVFNSISRIVIARLLGNEQVGIYAIGGKIGQLSQLIYIAFAGGWQYFAFSTMKDEDQVKMTSNIFEYLGIITFVASAFVAALSEVLFKLLFTGDFVKGSIIAPYLFLAPLLLMLFQVAGNQFLVIKKTLPNLFILSVGAILCVVITWFGVENIGIEGAALGTLVGYSSAVAIGVLVLEKKKLLEISFKFKIATVATIAYGICWRFIIRDNMIWSISLAFVLTILFAVLYKNDIMNLIGKRPKAKEE